MKFAILNLFIGAIDDHITMSTYGFSEFDLLDNVKFYCELHIFPAAKKFMMLQKLSGQKTCLGCKENFEQIKKTSGL